MSTAGAAALADDEGEPDSCTDPGAPEDRVTAAEPIVGMELARNMRVKLGFRAETNTH